MRIDSNEMEKQAMDLFKKGETKQAQALQEQFLSDVLNSGEDHCPCPAACRYHGKCVECIVTHRARGDHLPYCFREMVNREIDSLSALTQHSFDSETRLTQPRDSEETDGDGELLL